MRIAILRNEDPDSSHKWQLACEKLKLSYLVIDLTSSDWLSQVQNESFDFFLLKPPGLLSHFKNLYDERIYIITKILKKTTFPSYEECFVYENKKLLSYYLEANAIPHPRTKIFYSKKEAVGYTKETAYPIVAKTSIGASGSGVQIIRNVNQAKKYIGKAFSRKGIKRRFGPNRVTGSPIKWLSKAIKAPDYLLKKIKEYLTIYKHGETDFVIFQEFIPHEFEWRAVRIGNSYFAHKKIKFGDKASGSKGIEYCTPPETILNFTRELCEKYDFQFMAVDLFEDDKGGYLVNEMQTIFGHVQDFILSIDGTPGRYLYINNSWVFEPGDFNTNESFDLRLQTALELYGQN
jgi:glutathione synthase/RimK-type ligase-like ATP-grasp enzyme